MKSTSGKKYKGFSYSNGNIVKTAYLDGYCVGDRLLEGVMFRVSIDDDCTLNVGVTPKCAKYFSRLNKDMWLGEILEYAEQTDFFVECEDGTSPSGDDLMLESL